MLGFKPTTGWCSSSSVIDDYPIKWVGCFVGNLMFGFSSCCLAYPMLGLSLLTVLWAVVKYTVGRGLFSMLIWVGFGLANRSLRFKSWGSSSLGLVLFAEFGLDFWLKVYGCFGRCWVAHHGRCQCLSPVLLVVVNLSRRFVVCSALGYGLLRFTGGFQMFTLGWVGLAVMVTASCHGLWRCSSVSFPTTMGSCSDLDGWLFSLAASCLSSIGTTKNCQSQQVIFSSSKQKYGGIWGMRWRFK